MIITARYIADIARHVGATLLVQLLPRLAVTSLGLALFATAPASGQLSFYSVTRDTMELILVEDTGSVTVVGPIDEVLPFNAAQLEWFNGELHALVRHGFNDSRLLRLDPNTGAVLSSVLTQLNGNNVSGETLFAFEGVLYMSADPASDTTSEKVASVAPDGTMVEVADFTAAGALDNDIDGLTAHPTTGVLYNLDHDGGVFSHTELFVALLHL